MTRSDHRAGSEIEHPDGDDMRYASQASIGGLTAAFLALNRGKQSLVLDLATPGGHEVAIDLVRRADVLVENFTPGVMERLGLGYDVVAKVNPRVTKKYPTHPATIATSEPARNAF